MSARVDLEAAPSAATPAIQRDRLANLTRDATLAKALAETACQLTVDNGSANLDATFYMLRKAERAEPVINALRAAGLSASETRWLGMGRGVMVQPPCVGQANKRHAANEALCESLRGAGWPVVAYYQMD